MPINTKEFFKEASKLGIEYYSGVPDSLLKDFCGFASDNLPGSSHQIAANEGSALSLGIGYHLSTKQIPLVYFQNSGLGNLVNPLLSLADEDVYSVPLLMLIGWRGQPKINDEPQHVKQGKVMLAMLDAMDITYFMLSDDTSNAVKDLKEAYINAKNNSKPVALIARKGIFSEYKRKINIPFTGLVKRIEAINFIIKKLPKETVFVSTTGFTSRELFYAREINNQSHEKDFMLVGGMGHAISVATGIKHGGFSGPVCCLDGDGSFLMHMGSSAVSILEGVRGITHVIFNNGMHESVGGQPTVANKLNIESVASQFGYTVCRSHHAINGIKEFFDEIDLSESNFLEIICSPSDIDNLPRPSETPLQSKVNFMKRII
ncbi:phosphonopyruvate decarboxylase [Gammaproteobacteria bacterium]|nr:phosphonopyruvate decarboxylase [Gammaproteobacteria bacterium]